MLYFHRNNKAKRFDVIISHISCCDGNTACAIAHEFLNKGVVLPHGMFNLKKSHDNEIHTSNGAMEMMKCYPNLVPIVFQHHGTPIDKDLIKNRNILIMDLDVGPSNIKLLDENCKSAVILDHHGDAQLTTLKEFIPGLTIEKLNSGINEKILSKKINLIIKSSKDYSAANLAWMYFHPGVQVPLFVDVVRIRDTWSWETIDKYDVRSFVEGLEYVSAFDTFKTINIFIKECTIGSSLFEDIIKQGRIVWGFKTKIIETSAHKTTLGYIKAKPNGVVQMFNVLYTSTTIFTSDIGDRMRTLNEKYWNERGVTIHFTAVWKYIPPTPKKDGIVVVCLRSPFPGLQLGLIANTICDYPICSGNGHTEAASFSFFGIDNFHKIFLKSNSTPPPSPESIFSDILTD